jgi:hypothetical protein
VAAAQPPQQAIQNAKACGIAVQDRGLRQLDEFGRYVEAALEAALRRLKRWICRRCLEQFRRLAAHRPGHIGRFHTVQHQRPRSLSPAVEIGFAIEGDEMH